MTISAIGAVGAKPLFVLGINGTISISIISLSSTLYIKGSFGVIYVSQHKYPQPFLSGGGHGYYYNWANLINSINKEYIDDLSFEKNDGYLENYNKAYNFIAKNKSDPTFAYLYSVHVDHAGHNNKWMSPEYIKSIEDVDVEIGKFISKLKSSGLYSDTNFLLITDHGGTRTSGHGGLSVEEMEVPRGVTGPSKVKGKRLYEPNSNTNTAKVIATLFESNETPKSWIGKVPTSIFE